jgi:hypothetical protein
LSSVSVHPPSARVAAFVLLSVGVAAEPFVRAFSAAGLLPG